MFMLDSAAINAVILFNLKNPDLTQTRLRRKLLEEMSCNLIKGCAIERYSISKINNHIGLNKNIIASFNRLIDVQNVDLVAVNSSVNCPLVKRCSHFDCKGKENKHRNQCQSCSHIYCKKHCEIMTSVICNTCILD